MIMKFNFNHRLLDTRFLIFGEKKSTMVPEELASLFHFPSSRYNMAPNIKWLSYKVLPAPVDLPSEGILLGYNVYRGLKREVHILRNDRTRHHYCIGKSGSGKSVFLSWMARQDIINGDGVCVIDPHGDLIEELVQFVPKERAKDVIIFNPADVERPMGLNILEAKNPEQQDLASSQATEIFIKIFGDEIFGPRIQHYFRNGCLTLMEDLEEGATLIDVPRIFVDDEFMKYKVSKVKNPVVRSFWEHEYAHTGERERQEMIPYFSAKFGPFITNSIMRNVIGQTKSAFNFRECMDQKKILLINLSKGKIGDLNTQLLGLVMVARLQMAAMSRVDVPEDQRKDFYLYVDEFQNFATDSFCSILSEARKYHLALIMAHQYIKQLEKKNDTSIRDAVFGNVGTMMSFKVGADDAEYMAKEYAPVLTEQDVLGIANYKAYIKLNIKNTTSRPFSLETIYDMTNANKKIGEIVTQYSRMKYGRKKEFVDQEISARIGIDLS
jgi:type IV secretory pathway TraG/TraD family ATPase VirD4